jgi:acylpyruvate hydrolase
MKLASFKDSAGDTRMGALLTLPSGELLLDLTRGFAAYLTEVEKEAQPTALAQARVPSDMRLFLEGGERSLEAARKALAYMHDRMARGGEEQACRKTGLLHELAAVTFLPPIPRPGKIISVGANYREHMAEFDENNTDAENLKVLREGMRVDYPPAFAKLSSVMVGHDQPIVYPPYTQQLDYEAELCVVIGKRCKNVAPDRYLDVVAGYTIMNDVSMRDIQMKEMKRGIMLMGKNLDTTAPTGPYLVTKDEIADPQNLQISTFVNGERRQFAKTDQMIFDIASIIAFYSRMTLEPGDIFTTGSPAGVGITRSPPERYLLKPGDVVEIEIEGIGRLRNPVIAER